MLFMKINYCSLCLLIITSIILIPLQSCNNSNDKKSRDNQPSTDTIKAETNTVARSFDDIRDCRTMANFLVTEETARKMINNFGSMFNVPGLTDSFWVDACVIIGLKDLVLNDKEYDGFRIYSIQKQKGGLSEILLVPTKGDGKEEHFDMWGKLISVNCKNPQFINFNIEQDEQEKWTDNFQRNYRGEKGNGPSRMSNASRDSLSRGMWMSECALDLIAEFLEKDSSLDGVWVYSAAYNKKLEGTGAFKDRQSTFILVVSSPIDGQHRPEWDVITKNYLSSLNFFDGLNHGQLCPNICVP